MNMSMKLQDFLEQESNSEMYERKAQTVWSGPFVVPEAI